MSIEDRVVPVSEIFRLQGDAELEEAEKRYLPGTGKNVKAVILAAAQGSALGELTRETPKALLKVRGKPILSMLIDNLNHVGINEIVVVRGFGKNTGLGLFLSKEILSITDITITENGEPDKGARFEMVVPKGAYRFSM